MREKIDLTVVVTAHNEGLVAHKTMRGVLAGLVKIENAGFSWEIVVNIDNGDMETVNYFKRYKGDARVRVFENSFGDTAPSRNFAIKKARGEFVAVIDGDDLVSDNWMPTALKMLKETDEKMIVHPEAVLTFGVDLKNNVLTMQKPSYEIEKDRLVLLGENRWCATLMTSKVILQKFPYRLMGAGYGHEDYVFDVETVGAGVLHQIAPGTVLFYRRSNKSRLSTSTRGHVTIPYMDLFDFAEFKDTKEIKPTRQSDKLKIKGYAAYKKVRNNRVLNFFITPVAKATLKILDKKSLAAGKVPKFVIEEWIRINAIEAQLYPHPWIVDKVQFYEAEKQIGVGNAYAKLAKAVTGLADYVFIVPWVERGGADKVLFNYIKALKEIHPDWHFAVIATLPAKNAWVKKLPKYVDFVDFGKIAEELPPEMQDTLMCRLVTQLKTQNLHIINSEFGYNWARRHYELLKEQYDVCVSLFCNEFIPGSDLRGEFSYSDPYLLNIFGAVKKVFTDNKTIIEKTIEDNAFDPGKFLVHYQPVEDMEMLPVKQKFGTDGKMHILWAERVVPTKLPDLVVEIGKRLDPEKFAIDMYGSLGEEINSAIFNGAPAVRYCGVFDGFSSLPIEQYDVLLYTALDDGVPNVILEATAAGLPVIASNDGGVGEFIKSEKTGILIEEYLKPEEYVVALERVRRNPSDLVVYVENAQKLLKKQHSWAGFVEKVKRDIG